MNETEFEILLVEDSMEDAELTMRALRKNNVARNIIHLKDGAEAIDFLFGQGIYAARNIRNKPEVILLDLKMPKVNGLEVLSKISSDDNTKTIPVVVLTSSKEDPDIEKSYRLGANSYIVKPVEFANFSKVVNDLGIYWLVVNEPSKK